MGVRVAKHPFFCSFLFGLVFPRSISHATPLPKSRPQGQCSSCTGSQVIFWGRKGVGFPRFIYPRRELRITEKSWGQNLLVLQRNKSVAAVLSAILAGKFRSRGGGMHHTVLVGNWRGTSRSDDSCQSTPLRQSTILRSTHQVSMHEGCLECALISLHASANCIGTPTWLCYNPEITSRPRTKGKCWRL